MELIGIENEGEFFPAGTLSDGLQDELKEISNRWSADLADKSPLERLKRAAAPHHASLHQFLNSADPQRRQEIAREAIFALVESLGYTFARDALPTAFDGEPVVPVVGRCVNSEGRDVLWLIEAPLAPPGDEASDPLSLKFDPLQFSADERSHAELGRSIEEILADGIFSLKRGPRYVLIVDMVQLLLVDRNRWPSRSVLRFDLQEIFSRKEPDTLLTMAGLISREARAPETGVPIAERLEEEAQRNANAVTTSLKATIRDAIEILGQEVLDVTGGKYPVGPKKGNWIEGRDLSRECLRYMYRLLFLFYAEANRRLDILDLRDSLYATGYSIEALRELETVRLRSPQEREGTYLWESLQLTLELIYSGRGGAMKLPAVKVSLLDPDSTPILNALKLRNVAIQKIISLLSLKRMKSGISRISYAKLGIGQLGAVYETLISFTGVVAKDDLIELRPRTGRGGGDEEPEDAADEEQGDDSEEGDKGQPDERESRADKIDLLAPSYFVAKHRASEFKPDEIIFDGSTARVYKKGTFIYRLAGRDREKSASYYTPEPLARLLVKHALMERCKDMPADDILDLKILEPAMGSAAFLVETTNQLADLYLERKQQEIGRTIPQEDILLEKQKVRAYISDRNCFGVDLNPVAVELGAISLWLNSLHRGSFSPWFGDQLHAGNSLIGARRAAYDPTLLKAKKKDELWFSFPPTEIGWKGTRPEGFVWQFLLPAEDMAAFDKDKSIAEFAGAAQEEIKRWRKGGFFSKFEPYEVKLVQKLSAVVDQLFEEVAESLARSRSSTNDAITIWPDREMLGVKGETFHEKQRRLEKLTGNDHAANTLPYKRLKTAMDAWCALWLWPLDKAHLLPSRIEFLNGMAMILEGGFSADGSLAAPSMAEFADPALDMFYLLEPDAPAKDLFKAAEKRQSTLFRETNVEALVEAWEWLGVAVKVAEEARFAHLDLIFADVLKARRGFDIIVGNPPWTKPSWNEGDVIGDIDPGFITRKLSATEARDSRAQALSKEADRKAFLAAYTLAKGAMTATGSAVMNPFAGGGQNNLYRCFIDLSFRQITPAGYAALIHQDGHLTDPKSGPFRREWYGRIAKHFEFSNKIKSKMFAEVHDEVKFSLNLYRGKRDQVHFDKVTNAFLPSQVEDSYNDPDGLAPLPTIKNSEGNWDTRGHRDRIVLIDHDALAAIHALTEDESVPVIQARFLQPYSAKMLEVFRSMAAVPPLSEAVKPIEKVAPTPEGEREIEISTWQMNSIWHESGSQKEGYLRRETGFRDTASEMVISGPMFHVGNPLYKTPKAVCRTSADYNVVDLVTAPDDYLPRTNYAPALSLSAYRQLLPQCRWDPTKSHVDFYRLAIRRMVALNGERSLICAILSPGMAHVNTVESISFSKNDRLVALAAQTQSMVMDFLTKVAGRADIFESTAASWPLVDPGETAKHRALRLACLTTGYSNLWNEQAPTLKPLPWHSTDSRLTLDGPFEGPAIWDRTAALRNDFARRLALVEIDVLVAQALGLTIEQLIDIYRIYFPVLQQNEAATWYDRKGRIVWTASKGLPGIGWLNEKGKSAGRKEWDAILALNPSELRCNATIDFLPGGAQVVERVYEGPFDTCNRIEDYKRAWAYFDAQNRKDVAA
ncbi:Eco57I restriction-modification methylase domain-containing protein [Rhizobium herbae]